MESQLLHVGFGNFLARNRVLAITNPDSAPIKRFIQEAKANNSLIDLTSGRKTKAIVFLDTGSVVLAALSPETIANRLTSGKEGTGLKAPGGEESHG